jgi:hypothetical protein
MRRVYCCCRTINCPVTVAIPIGKLPELGEDLHENNAPAGMLLQGMSGYELSLKCSQICGWR